MTLYRARCPISVGQRILRGGTVIRPGDLKPKAMAVLVRQGTLLPLSVPPLAALPGWAHRSKRLAQVGIVDVEQAVTADVDEVARHCGVSPGLIQRWQAELLDWLKPPEERRG